MSNEEKDIIKEENNKSEIQENIENTEKKLGTVGNFLLLLFIVLIIGTGILVYYLVHNAKSDLEASVNDIAGNANIINMVVKQEEKLKEENKPEPNSIAEVIDSALSNTSTNSSTSNTVNTVSATNVKTLNEQLIVLYEGYILDTSEMKVVDLQYIDKTDINKDKYVITYYNYENFASQGSGLGTLSDELYEGVLAVENVGKIAVSEKFNCLPREVQVVNSVSSVISDNNDLSKYDTIKNIIVDLEGNGTNENILILSNRQTGYSKISLVDFQGKLVADLAYIEKSKWESVTTEDYYLSISNIEVLDIDNDNVMEIILELPTYEGPPRISLLKYKNGELQGEKDYECSLLP